MRGFRIVCVGKIKEDYFRKGLAYYRKEIGKSFPIEIIECIDEPTPEKASKAQESEIQRVEGQRILQKIKEEDHVIALCIDGKHYNTEKWIAHVRRQMEGISGDMVFVIGGSLGLSEEVRKRADEKLSFSAMTFPHQMMRMILCEQIARVLSH